MQPWNHHQAIKKNWVATYCTAHKSCILRLVIVTSSNGNISRVTSLLWEETTVTGGFPHKGQWRGTLIVSLIHAWTNGKANNRAAGDLRRHRAHYDVTVMCQMSLLKLVVSGYSCQFKHCLTYIYLHGYHWYLLKRLLTMWIMMVVLFFTRGFGKSIGIQKFASFVHPMSELVLTFLIWSTLCHWPMFVWHNTDAMSG